ncbi:MAG: hypothetical protein IKE03_01855 [Blautia sp.]|nr:hypothetical protein [Blautia sp.]
MKKILQIMTECFLTVCLIIFLSGGCFTANVSAAPDPHNLSEFVYRTVNTAGRGCLVFQSGPGGSVIDGHQFWDGDQIFVNLNWREQGYAMAYEDGVFGYVDASYINWNSGTAPATKYDPHTLSDFGYRTVTTGGRGCLVFQTEPAGSVISGYQYWDGDQIYVNLYWREKGYTLAYSDGVYGYVDASYINWGSAPSAGSSTGGVYDFANYGYRTVNTAGRGCLVFQNAPAGSVISGHEFWDGDSIYVNLIWRDRGYAMAYENGEFGYVDASYINWGTTASAPAAPAYNARDLSHFGYRTVNTAGRGCLVFQSAPAGSVISGYQFWDGDSIYVNLTWREQGYALAYSNGVYGYVDASYINW